MANTTFDMHETTSVLPDVRSTVQPDDTMMETAKKMHWVTSVIFGTIFVVVGLIGNTLSILVWSRKPMRSSTGTYLIAQAIADTGLLIFFFITDSLTMMEPDIKTSYSYGVFFSYIGYPIFFLFVVVSIWMTVGVTVDRYIQVCWISQAKKMANTKKALVGIGIISLLCFVVNIPHFKTFQPVSNTEKNVSDPAFVHTTFGAGEGSKNYEFWVHCMFLVLVPWISIFSLNMLIIHRVAALNRKMESKRGEKGKEKARRSENQMTRLLLTVTFTFLVLIALQCVTQCFFMLEPETADMRVVSEAFAIAKLGIVINSSINFFLYCLSGRKFRKELRNLIAENYSRISRAESSTSYSLRDTSSSTKTSLVKTKSAV